MRLLIQKKISSGINLAGALLGLSFLMLINHMIPVFNAVPYIIMSLLVSGIWLIKDKTKNILSTVEGTGG
jgi:hypothetical protein